MSTHALHLLTDSRGPYGIAFDGSANHVANLAFMIRPDKVMPPERALRYYSALLHKMPRAAVTDAIETTFADRLRDHFLYDDHDRREDRRYYFAAQSRARAMTNALLGELYQAADQRFLTLARRFSPQHRLSVYRGCVWGGERLAQMAEVFPLLAISAITNYHAAKQESAESEKTPWIETPQHDPELFEMIRAGAPMREIAKRANIDPALRRVKPGAVADASLCMVHFDDMPPLVRDYLPESLPAQRRFFHAISEHCSPTGRAWAAAHYADLGKTNAEVRARSSDLNDWIRSSELKRLASLEDGRFLLAMLEGHIEPLDDLRRDIGAEFVTRQFNSKMAPATVFRLSDEWHEAVSQASDEGGPQPLPRAWIPGDEVDGLTIQPITDTAALHRAARHLHNCAATYRSAIEFHQCCLFVVHDGEPTEPRAMAEIQQRNGKPIVAQLKGRFNSEPDKATKAAITTWLRRKRSEFKLPQMPQQQDFCFGDMEAQL